MDGAPIEKIVRENEMLRIGHVAPEEGWFEFKPPRDPFNPAALDMRTLLNEPRAGSRGRVIARGGDLVFEKTGEKAHFWGVVADSWLWPQPKKNIDYLSRRLAKSLSENWVGRATSPPLQASGLFHPLRSFHTRSRPQSSSRLDAGHPAVTQVTPAHRRTR